MAKAIAICTCERCGKTFEKHAVKYNSKEADSWESWAADHYTVCPECEEAEYQAKIAEQKAQDEKDGLPELIGTVKQVNWAVEIRHVLLTQIDHEMDRARKDMENPEDEQCKKEYSDMIEQYEITSAYIMSQTSASWWINHRNYSGHFLLRYCHDEAVEAAKLAETEDEADDDTEIVPEDATEGTVEIVVAEDRVEAYYPKDQSFITIVKEAGYRWNGKCWSKRITELTGDAVNRAAELANSLLRSGFSVRCKDEQVRQMAVDGSFEPEQKNWIIKVVVDGHTDTWLGITLPRKYDDRQNLYDKARSIKGSRYHKDPGCGGNVIVPISQYAQLLDFADLYGYKISSSAQAEIDRYTSKSTVRAAEPQKKQETASDKLSKILQSDDTVLSDLEDD